MELEVYWPNCCRFWGSFLTITLRNTQNNMTLKKNGLHEIILTLNIVYLDVADDYYIAPVMLSNTGQPVGILQDLGIRLPRNSYCRQKNCTR